jgi:hypothetical protein
VKPAASNNRKACASPQSPKIFLYDMPIFRAGIESRDLIARKLVERSGEVRTAGTKYGASHHSVQAGSSGRFADLAIARPPFPLYAGDAKALENIRCGFHNEIPHLNRLFSCGRSSYEGLGQLLRLQLDKRSRCSVGQASNVFYLPYCSENTSGIFWTEEPSVQPSCVGTVKGHVLRSQF